MNLAHALQSVPRHLLSIERYRFGSRVSVDEIPEALFIEGARMRNAGAPWAAVIDYVRAQGISIADSTVRHSWRKWMQENPENE